jgi:hypothetical protein
MCKVFKLWGLTIFEPAYPVMDDDDDTTWSDENPSPSCEVDDHESTTPVYNHNDVSLSHGPALITRIMHLS